jgi:hypothetical protein
VTEHRAATKPKPRAAPEQESLNGEPEQESLNGEPEPEVVAEPPLYGDAPTFTYTADDGEIIIFPAHSTIRGLVDSKSYLEMMWEIHRDQLSDADQIFLYLDRSGATEEMQRRLVHREAEVNKFFRQWINADDEPPTGLPPES